MTPDEIQQHRVNVVEPEFITHVPTARLAVVYEFDTQEQADEARALLLATAFVSAERARVERVPWNGKQRVLAIA